MSDQRPQSTSLFRTSLRSWQANYKARQAQAESSTEQAAPEQAAPEQAPAPRVKRLAPHKRRAQRQAAARRG
jgi:hypothetical protein